MERTFLRYLTEAGIQSLYSVGCVHDFSDGAAIVEELLHMSPVSGPYVYRSGVLVPRLLEALKFALSSFEAWRSVDPPEMGGVSLVILRRYVFYGIADQVNDAALYDDVLEDMDLAPSSKPVTPSMLMKRTSSNPRFLISSNICIQ